MSELSPETEELLARGREGTPLSPSRRDDLKGAVLAKLATGAIVTSSTSAAAWTLTTKTIGVAVLAAVIGTGTVGVVKYQRSAHAPQTSTQTNSVNTAANVSAGDPAPTVEAIATPPSMSAIVNSEAPQGSPVVQPTLETAPPITTNSPTPTPPPSQNSNAAIAHATAPVTNPTFGSDAPNTANSQAIVSSPNSGSSTATTPTTTSHASSLAEENALLVSAKQALDDGDPARALRLLDEHASRFPNSALEPERSAERVFAFCAEQKNDAAHAAATSFLSAHPTGPLAARVRASCGGR